jgi:hypothetical protein
MPALLHLGVGIDRLEDCLAHGFRQRRLYRPDGHQPQKAEEQEQRSFLYELHEVTPVDHPKIQLAQQSPAGRRLHPGGPWHKTTAPYGSLPAATGSTWRATRELPTCITQASNFRRAE